MAIIKPLHIDIIIFIRVVAMAAIIKRLHLQGLAMKSVPLHKIQREHSLLNEIPGYSCSTELLRQ